MKSLLNRFIALKLHHLLFWSCYYLFWVLLYLNMYQSLGQLMMVTAIYVFAHSGLYYLTQYILMPKVLHRHSIGLFLLSYLAAALLMSIIMYLSFIVIFPAEAMQNFGGSYWLVILYLLFSNIFAPGMLFGLKSIIDGFRNRRLNEQLKSERLESELHYLKAQVNPHFLFNTINSVYVLIKIDPERASQTLIKLSELLRSQLYEFGDKEIEIEKELDYLDNYIALEKTRKGDQVCVTVEKTGELSGFKLAPLMLIPFLENSFKYVTNSKVSDNVIKVGFHNANGIFSATFYNTKEKEISNGHKNAVGGIGLKNIKRRLELIYPKKHTLKIHDHLDSFEVNLKIQVNEK